MLYQISQYKNKLNNKMESLILIRIATKEDELTLEKDNRRKAI